MSRYALDWVGAVTVPEPGPMVRLANIQPTPAGGCSFEVPTPAAEPAGLAPALPKVVRALWLPPTYDQSTPAETVFEEPCPAADYQVPGPGPYTVVPVVGLAAGAYLLALVSVYDA